jgi:1,2-phenylacetyl-CoA epoxidase catalytic subunit
MNKTSIEWNDKRYEVQSWLERIAWRNLDNTQYGMSPQHAAAPEWIHESPLLKTACTVDLLAFVHAERLALDVSAALLPMAPDMSAKRFLATQVMDEARHYEVFSQRLRTLGIGEEEEQIVFSAFESPRFQRFADTVMEQVDRKDFIAAVIALNFVLEGLAKPLYDFETRYWSAADPGFSEIIRGAFADEVQHGNFGELAVKAAVGASADQRNRCRALVRDFKMLVGDIFEESRAKYGTMYQSAALENRELFEGIMIFQEKPFFSLTADEQIQQVGLRVETEFVRRCERVGL